jgi:hypothetical protein
LLGVAIGPHVLGLVERGLLVAYSPIAGVAVGWLALVLGGSLGVGIGTRRTRAALLGILLALLCLGAVFAVVYFVAFWLTELSQRNCLILASGSALVSCETTRHAVSWVIERYAARGPLSDLVAGLADADDFVPLVLVAVPFSLVAPSEPYQVPWWGWGLATVGLGVLLGLTAAALLRVEATLSRGFGVLLGAAFLCTGICWRLGLSPLTAMCALGLSLALFSRHRVELAQMLGRTEHAVMLPMLLLAGASVTFELPVTLWIVLGLACFVRLLVRLSMSPLLALAAGVPARLGPTLSLGLMPAGALTLTTGLTFALRFPGDVGDVVLCTAAAQTVLGELIGPLSLRRALLLAGEVRPESLMPPPPERDQALREVSS